MANDENSSSSLGEANENSITYQKEESLGNNGKLFRHYLAFFLLFSCAIIAFACWSIYQNHILRLTMDSQVNLMQRKFNQLEQQLNEQAKLTFSLASLQQSQVELKRDLLQVKNNFQSALQTNRTTHWELLKTRYYLELAQTNNFWSNDPLTTVTLLQQADNQLTGFHVDRLLNLRKTIAQEISALQSMPKTDQIALLSTLDAIANSVQQLPLYQKKYPFTPHEHSRAADSSATGWRATWHDSLAILKNLVVVKHENDPQMLTPTYQMMSKEIVSLTIKQAQWAVIHQNNALYHLSLHQAIQEISRAFPQTTSTQALLAQLEQLRKTNLINAKIPIDQALTELDQILNNSDATIIENQVKQGDGL